MDLKLDNSATACWADVHSMGLGSDVGSIVYIGVSAPTSFAMMKEKSGQIYAERESRYPLT